MNILQRAVGYSAIGILLFSIDRMTKLRALMAYQNRMIINHYLSFDVVFNRGISWGFFYSNNASIFVSIGLLIGIITLIIAYNGLQRFLAGRLAIGELLVVTGSLSNLIDRFYYHGVIDFIELSYNGYTWPLFNVADMCIVGGIFCMVMEHYKS